MLDKTNILTFLADRSKYAKGLPACQGACDTFLKWTIPVHFLFRTKIVKLEPSNFAQGKNGKKMGDCQAPCGVIPAEIAFSL
jgi:hypothetical protein